MAEPADMHHLPTDMATPSDMAGPPGDMVTQPADMTSPPADMTSPPEDMTMPADMTMPDDMPPPPADMTMTDDMPPPADMTMPPADMTMAGDMTLPPIDLGSPDMTPPADATEFYVLRVGTGAAALTNAATAAFLERRKISDGSLVGTALALPTATSGANRRVTIGGTTATEGGLNLSSDGKYLLLGGYDAAVGTASVGSTASSTVNRVIARLDAAGALDSSTAGDFFTAASLRNVASTDGSSLWASGSTGVLYTTLHSTAMPVSVAAFNVRWAGIFSGQLYGSSASTMNHGINQVGTGTPMTTATVALLNGFSAQPNASHYGFLALDRDGMAGIDVIYAADDRTVATGGGIQRWSLSGTTWKLDGTIAKGLTTAGARGLTGYVSSGKVVLLATTAETPARVVKYIDDGSALDMLSATQLAAAATNTAYRGIALPPR